MLLCALLVAAPLVALAPTAFAESGLPHAPLTVVGDADLFAQAQAEGWPGAGTALDPIVIAGYTIDASGQTGIHLEKTTAHVLIDRVHVQGAGTGACIRTVEAANVRFENVLSQGCEIGIEIFGSDDGAVVGSHLTGNTRGIDLTGSHRITIADSVFEDNGFAIFIRGGFVNMKFRPPLDIEVRGNQVGSGGGIHAHFVSGASVENNTVAAGSITGRWVDAVIAHNAAGSIALDLADGVAVVDNTLRGDLRFERSSAVVAERNIISGRWLEVRQTDDFLVQDNRWVGTGLGVLRIDEATDGLAHNNSFEKPAGEILIFTAARVTIRDNPGSLDRMTLRTLGSLEDVIVSGHTFRATQEMSVLLSGRGNLLIHDNDFTTGTSEPGTQGIILSGISGARIENNRFYHLQEAMSGSFPNSGVVVQGNTIRNCGTGLWVGAQGGALSFLDNHVTCRHVGIRTEPGSKALTVQGNMVQGSTRPFHLDGDGHKILSNTIDGGIYGMDLNGHRHSIEGNTVRNVPVGIEVRPGSSGISVGDNTVQAVMTGVAVDGRDHSIHGNTIEAAAIALRMHSNSEHATASADAVQATGIGMRIDGDGHTVDGNTIRDTPVGIHLLPSSTNATVSDNAVQTAEVGLRVDGNGHSITGNSLLDAAVGLEILRDPGKPLTANTVVGGTVGFLLVDVNGSVISDNGVAGAGVGFELTGTSSGNTLIGNTVEDARTAGFRVASDGTGNTIASASVTGGSGPAIVLEGAGNNVTQVVVRNAPLGILARGDQSGTVIQDPFIEKTGTGSVATGIRLDSVTGIRIEAGEIWNAAIGILADGGGSNDVSGMTLRGNDVGIRLNATSGDKIHSVTLRTNARGIHLVGAIDATVQGNRLFRNDVGIHLERAAENTIYDNMFENPRNAEVEASPDNRWHVEPVQTQNIIGGPWTAGNFWSDYTGVDLDGDLLGDVPYGPVPQDAPFAPPGPIPHGPADLHPLMRAPVAVPLPCSPCPTSGSGD